jgi:type IV secretory pathway VirD2 relaxase
MLVTRRSLLTGFIGTPLTQNKSLVTSVNRNIHGKNCVRETTSEKWMENVEKYQTMQNIMHHAKIFYSELLEEENMTREALQSYKVIENAAVDLPSLNTLVEEMKQDAIEKVWLTECLDL